MGRAKASVFAAPPLKIGEKPFFVFDIIDDMRLIFVRHGQTDTNLIEMAGKPILDDDASLNEEGLKQAQRVAEELKGEKVDVIFASPLKRAMETAAEIARYHDAPVLVMDGLRERKLGTLVGERLQAAFDFDNVVRADDIESVDAFFERVYVAIDQIVASEYENVVVVSHGGVSHVFRAYFNKLEWKGNLRVEHLKNCEYKIYEI